MQPNHFRKSPCFPNALDFVNNPNLLTIPRCIKRASSSSVLANRITHPVRFTKLVDGLMHPPRWSDQENEGSVSELSRCIHRSQPARGWSNEYWLHVHGARTGRSYSTRERAQSGRGVDRINCFSYVGCIRISNETSSLPFLPSLMQLYFGCGVDHELPWGGWEA